MNLQKRSKDFDRMIVEAVQGNYSFFAWQSVGGIVEKCELKIKAFRKDYNEIELELCAGEEESLARVISGNRILNVYVPEMSVSFSSELKSVSPEKKVKLFIPSDFSFYERRKHERIQPAKTCYVSFEHNKQVIKKTIFDISMGGIAVVLPKSDKVNLSKKDFSMSLVLDVGAKKIKVKAECVSSITIDRFKFDYLPYGGFKLAFRFSEIAKADRDFLIQFITHEKLMQEVQKKAN
jgi:c-di-GMP-binding flagellar brake protein YcgR